MSGDDTTDEQRDVDLALDVAELERDLTPYQRALCSALRQATVSELARLWGVHRSTLADHVRKLRRPFESRNLAPGNRNPP